MKYTEEEAKALLKVMGYLLFYGDQRMGSKRYRCSARTPGLGPDFYGESFVEVLDRVLEWG